MTFQIHFVKNALQIATPWRHYKLHFLQVLPVIIVGRGSSVGITTRYGTGGPGIESRRWGRDFSYPPRAAPGPTQPPVPGLSRG